MKERIKVGIVGAGRFGEAHAQNYSSMSGVEVAGVFDPDAAKAGKLADTYGGKAFDSLDALLEAPDIRLVSIVTPENAHLEPFLKGVEAGKAVYVEKPLAVSVEDIRTMVDASRGAIALGGHLLRYETRYRHIKEHIPEYGAVYHLYFRRLRALWEMSIYGRTHTALIMQSHDINICNWYAGVPFKRVVALEGHYRGTEVADAMSILVEYENGVTATLESGWLFPDDVGYGADDRCSVACEKGSFDLRIPGVDFYHYGKGGVQFPNPYYDIEVGGKMYGPLRAALDYAVACVAKGEIPQENTIPEAAETVALALAAIQSAQEGRFVARDEGYGVENT
jgi:UDP-N-acetylglucosamine 3-dehydrogenase